jgi:uncharacterized protein
MRAWTDLVGGQWRAIAPLAHAWLPSPALPTSQEVCITLVDDRFGPTLLHGTFCDRLQSDSVVVLVHGMGDNRHASYVKRATSALHAAGFATLAVDLRGVDRRGGGFAHAAQVQDLRAVCRSPVLRRFRSIFVLGFAMGGHLAIHYAASDEERRLRGVAAVCAPLDLQATQVHLDKPQHFVYRHWVLRGLKQIYAAVARKHDVPTPNKEVQRCRTFYEWDRLTVVPRYGYESPENYYRRESASQVLADLSVNTVLLFARNDPIVPPQLAMPWLAQAPFGRLHVKVLTRGSHLRFGRGQSLGFEPFRDEDVISQLATHWCGLAD